MSGELEDVRIEGPGARIRRTVSDGRGVEVKKLKRRVVGEKDFKHRCSLSRGPGKTERRQKQERNPGQSE